MGEIVQSRIANLVFHLGEEMNDYLMIGIGPIVQLSGNMNKVRFLNSIFNHNKFSMNVFAI